MEESTSREKVLKKVRHALIYKTDNPFPHVDFDSPVYKPMSDTPDVNFAQEFTKAGGVFIYCENEAEVAATLSALNIECKWQNIYCTEPELQYLLTQAGVPFDSDEESLQQLNVGITSCEFLVSRLGSIMVSSKNSRRLNVYPETHVVIAYVDQLVDDLKDAFEAVQKKYAGKLPSMLSVITGPSRTADIEKTLVMGAHGPRQLFVILVETPASDDEI
ncbi:MAG: LUD domain-containing protein [Bacteroidales bacterium]